MQKIDKTYSTRDSLLVTHAITSRAFKGLGTEEQTGFAILPQLWPYVKFHGK